MRAVITSTDTMTGEKTTETVDVARRLTGPAFFKVYKQLQSAEGVEDCKRWKLESYLRRDYVASFVIRAPYAMHLGKAWHIVGFVEYVS